MYYNLQYTDEVFNHFDMEVEQSPEEIDAFYNHKLSLIIENGYKSYFLLKKYQAAIKDSLLGFSAEKDGNAQLLQQKQMFSQFEGNNGNGIGIGGGFSQHSQ